MTYAPASVKAFMAIWTGEGGVNSGIVGDSAHAARPSYHNGWDRAVARYGTTSMTTIASKDYSYRLTRDQIKSDAAMAADLGRLDGSLSKLYAFSRWLVAQCQAGAPGTRYIREVIYSPDGKYVKRWDNHAKRSYTSLRKNSDGSITVITSGQGDSSHFWHTHISFHRDSESKDLAQIIRPYFAAPVTGDDMPTLTQYLPGYTATVKGTSNIRSAPTISSTTLIRTVPSSGQEEWAITGWVKGAVDPESGSDQWVCRWNAGRWEYTAKVNLIAGPTAPVGTAPVDTTPFDQADLDAAKAAGVTEGATQERVRLTQRFTDWLKSTLGV